MPTSAAWTTLSLAASSLRLLGAFSKVEVDRSRKHLDIPQFFGRGFEQRIAIFLGSADAHRMKEKLHGDPDFPFSAADSLLQRTCKQGIRVIDTHRILQFAV